MMDDEIVWITADKAKTLLEVHGITTDDQLIIQKAGLGLVDSKAAAFGLKSGRLFPGTPPNRFWQEVGLDASRRVNWPTGDFILQDPHDGPIVAVGVEFSLSDLVAAFQLPADAAQTNAPKSPAPIKAKGGRPPKEWWEGLWIEICAQVYRGKLIPNRQVDIENAMSDWISRSGFDASSSTVRDRARKLWKALQQEDENTLK